MRSNQAPRIVSSSAEEAAAAKPQTLSTRPAARRLPGPAGPFSGQALTRAPLPFLETMQRQYGDIVQVRVLGFRICLVAHPEGIKHVLQDNHRNYVKSADYKLLGRLLGQGLVTSEGSLWLRQRRLMQPMFHRQKIAAFAASMVDSTTAMLERWRPRAEAGEPLDVTNEMMRLTLEIVGRALLTMDLAGQADHIRRWMTVANERLGRMDLQMLMPWLPTPRNLRFRRAVRELRRVVLEIIERRRAEGRDYGDLLSMLLAARDEETGEGMTDEQLRDEVLTLILAGHETTANALSWTWHLLSQHPDVEQKLHAELDEVLGGRRPALADLPRLQYTGMIIDESMRLFPPVWAVGRSPIEDDEILGYRIAKGTNVILSQWLAHRHADFWDEPDRFDPDRFSAERSASRPRYAYFPFGGGPRQCIGNLFALTEAQLVLATVAQRYRVRAVPGHPVEPQPLVTLRPRYGIRVTLEARSR